MAEVPAGATPVTTAQARRFARWLVNNDRSGVQVVEWLLPDGDVDIFVRYRNRAGMERTIRSVDDFHDEKERP